MKNITLSIDEETLKAGCEYARKHNLSFSAFVRKLLEQNVYKPTVMWAEELFSAMDKAQADSGGRSWSREELHRA